MLRSGSPLGPFESIANTMHLGVRVSSRGALGHSWCFLGSPGLSLGHPWCILGFPGLSLEPLWGLPGDSLEPLWGLLGAPGDSQVTPWVLPVTPPGLPGTLPGLPVDSRGSSGTSRGSLGLSRDSRAPGTLRGLSGDSLGTPCVSGVSVCIGTQLVPSVGSGHCQFVSCIVLQRRCSDFVCRIVFNYCGSPYSMNM